MASQITIERSTPLRGSYAPVGSRKSAAQAIVASLLTSDPIFLVNVPRVPEIEKLLEMLGFLGVEADWVSEHEVSIEALEINDSALSKEIFQGSPHAFLGLGALLARLGEAVVPITENEAVGALQKLGVRIAREDGFYVAKGKLHAGVARLTAPDRLDTATLILAGMLGDAEIEIRNAAQEMEVDDLIRFARKMGGEVTRVEPGTIKVVGVPKLRETDYSLMYDRDEVVLLMCITAATRGDVLLEGVDAKGITAFLSKLENAGVSYKANNEGTRVWVEEEARLQPTQITTKPAPGFEPQWLPFFEMIVDPQKKISFSSDDYDNLGKRLAELGAKVSQG